MKTVTMKDEEGFILGYIETNANIEVLKEIFNKSFDEEGSKYNYDIDQFIEDINQVGLKAERAYLEEMEFY